MPPLSILVPEAWTILEKSWSLVHWGKGILMADIAAGEMANKGSPASAQASLCLGYCCTPWERVFLPENTPTDFPKESLFDNLRAKQADS